MARNEDGPPDTTDLLAPTLEEMQHWTGVIGRAQQLMLEYAAAQAIKAPPATPGFALPDISQLLTMPQPIRVDPARLADAQAGYWKDSLALWQRFLNPGAHETESLASPDRRFAAPQWQDNPLFDLIRQSYQLLSEHMVRSVARRGADRQAARADAVRDARLRRRARAEQLPSDQSARAREDRRDAWGEPAQGAGKPARRSRPRPAHPFGQQQFRDGRDDRGDAGQGDPRDAAVPS